MNLKNLKKHKQKHFRWIVERSSYFVPWEGKIRRIESHFGSVVSSYFVFVRWVMLVNLFMSAVIAIFIMIPGSIFFLFSLLLIKGILNILL